MEDVVEKFLRSTMYERFTIINDSSYTKELKDYLGDYAFAEYLQIVNKGVNLLNQKHLSNKEDINLLFIPGIMGSLLRSEKLFGVWWIDVLRARDKLNNLRLSPNGESDIDQNYQIVPFAVDITYEPFGLAVLERDDFNHDVFPYDWRKSPIVSAKALRDKIFSLHEQNGGQPIHLVAHSMGGLVVRATLMQYGVDLWPKIGRIVFIGTPHYGSPSIAGYLKNHLWGFDEMLLLGRLISRETFRSLWGALSMLPAQKGIYPGTRNGDPILSLAEEAGTYFHPCTNYDMYDASNWELNLAPKELSNLQNVLDGTVSFHQRMFDFHSRLNQGLRDRMAVIAGVGYKTLFRLANRSDFLGLWEHMTKETGRKPNDFHREGDGRVPLASASLEYVGDIRYVKGKHGQLPMLRSVYEDVFRWLNAERMKLPDTVEQALSQHLGDDFSENEYPHLTGSARSTATNDDPGYWNLEATNPERIAAIQSQLELGLDPSLPELNFVRLL